MFTQFCIIEEQFNCWAGRELIYQKPQIIKISMSKHNLICELGRWIREQPHAWTKWYSLKNCEAVIRYSINGWSLRRRIAQIGIFEGDEA